MKSSIETEGGTIDEAIAEALTALGAKRDDVRVEILSDVKRGLLGFGGQRARVRVTKRSEEGSAPDERASSDGGADLQTRPTAPADGPATKAMEALADLLTRMDFPATLSVAPKIDDRVVIRIESEHGGLLIGKHGQTLDSLEYLVNRLVARGEEVGPVVLDTEGYRERRKESLEQLARSLAERAKKRGRAETLMPMSARDRRIVHLALKGDSAVATRSLGEGHLRRVVISPAGAHGRARG